VRCCPIWSTRTTPPARCGPIPPIAPKTNEKHLADNGLRAQIHRKKPRGKPMPRRTARANARKSAVRSAVEHVFARQKGPMALSIRTIGLARARTKIGLANLVYNMKRAWSGSPHRPPHQPDPKIR